MPLIILRAAFILVTSGLGIVLINSDFMPESDYGPFLTLAGILLLAVFVILGDILYPRKRLETISAVYFGLIVGFFLSYMINIGLTPFYSAIAPKAAAKISDVSHLILTVFMCYISISLLLQTQNDFRFVIPYVEFARELRGFCPYVMDKSTVIDGRVLDIAGTHILDCPLILPQFVIAELKEMTESPDHPIRARGKRGLDMLNQLRQCAEIDFQLSADDYAEYRGQTSEMKIVILARKRQAKIVTTDHNLEQIAHLNDVKVLNLNELASALRPVFVVGEALEIRILKEGEAQNQGVGYLPDGTMVVVENGRAQIGRSVRILVTSFLQTNSGRMVFGKIAEVE